MKYIALSTAVTDRIRLFDGTCLPTVPGGAGIYALAGMKVWADDVGIVSGIGADYLALYAQWYQANSIPTSGLLLKSEHTPITQVVYRANGERVETPVFGRAHYHSIEPGPKDLEAFCKGARGVYVFRNNEARFWDEVFALRDTYGFKIVWEIAANRETLDETENTLQIARRVDMLSLNRTEALRLFRVGTLSEAEKECTRRQLPLTYLRNGAQGCCLIRAGDICRVPSVDGAAVVDVTGGGNSSTGGALIGLCADCSLAEIGAMGNVSASFCIAQHGVPPRFDEALHREAQRRKAAILAALGEERVE